MRSFCGVLAAISALLLVGQPASAESAQEILDRVKKRYDAINDAELKFTQHSKYQVSKLEQRVSGTLFMKKKNKYRVEYTDRMVITDGVTVWSYNPAQKQVLIDNFKLDPHILTPEKLLTSAPQEFYATVIGTEKVGTTQTKVLKLVPKDDAAAVRSMKLWIDDATWLIKQVELTDTGGNRTVYTVNDIKVNVGIPDSRFTYHIPEGVEAVDLR